MRKLIHQKHSSFRQCKKAAAVCVRQEDCRDVRKDNNSCERGPPEEPHFVEKEVIPIIAKARSYKANERYKFISESGATDLFI